MQSGGFDSAASDTSAASEAAAGPSNPATSDSGPQSSQQRETPYFPRKSLDAAGASPMRRNESAAAQLQDAVLPRAAGGLLSGATDMRRNQSSTALSDLRMLESKGPSSPTDRRDVIEAVVLHLHQLMLAAGASTEAADGTAVRDAMQTYIETIVRQLELPNSCIVAMVIYVQRAVDDARFTLTVRNWQPCLLAAFVVAAKLSFDEPVWNEDFVKALRISNVQTSQISRWEADFLQLIKFNTNVVLEQYSKVCFTLQRVYEATHGKRLQFFTFLMLQAKELEKARG
eukprot:CAMPEP_0119070102 /NCGR_PEP_ID=MMETSP1178-20130426/33904_1 /TAXON_ID=33656 /ORGANISM="unid sp, Strain CCMP2000" /LENGTH=285 /DNA_ID=CAMNT_0007051913 /DNA_START=185 /DNA_END=1042 /DNA_ORIENTATION=+